MVKGPCLYGTCMADREGHEHHSSPVFPESRDEGIFLGFLVELNVAAEVPAETDLDEDEGALLFI